MPAKISSQREDAEMAPSFNPDGSPRDLRQFLDRGGQIWLVQDLGSSRA